MEWRNPFTCVHHDRMDDPRAGLGFWFDSIGTLPPFGLPCWRERVPVAIVGGG